MKYSVVILSGGKSSRMGSDKGSLMLDGKTFIEVLVENMSCADEILLSTGEFDRYDNIDVCHIHDEYKNCGPVGGIQKALKVMRNEWLFAVACDMPYVDYTFVEELYRKGIEFNNQAKVIVPVSADGKRHMICALYHKSIEGRVAGLIEAGERRMQNIVQLFPAVFVPIYGKENNHKLMNVNTKLDYRSMSSPRIPVISFVGYSNSGKTTLIEKIIGYLKQKGFETAYIKHTHHELEFGESHKDSERMYANGARISVVLNENTVRWFERTEPDIEEVIAQVNNVDLIILEGFKKKHFDKIAVVTEETKEDILKNSNIRLVVGPDKDEEYDYSRDDADAIARWIIEEVIEVEKR